MYSPFTDREGNPIDITQRLPVVFHKKMALPPREDRYIIPAAGIIKEAAKQKLKENRSLKAYQVTDRITQEKPEILSNFYRVGAWVWGEFKDKPDQDTRSYLKDLGFRWNKKRSVWQHACGVFRKFSPRNDPRDHYGVQELEKV